MDLYIFSSTIGIEKIFSDIGKKKEYTLHFLPSLELKKSIKVMKPGCFLYVDAAGVTVRDFDRLLDALAGLEACGFGIIDPKGTVNDAARLFHKGASDYIGRDMAKKKLAPARLKAVLEFASLADTAAAGGEKKENKPVPAYLPSGRDWSGVKQGSEYTFCFMLVELDDPKELRRVYGANHVSKTVERFRSILERELSPLEGKIWMLMDFGGLLLFPFDGKSCGAILAAFRLILARTIISMEDLNFDNILSFRISMHIGNTLYRSKGQTGTIISDAINSVFHLGQKFAGPGTLTLTEEVFSFVPPGLRKCFVSAGTYEEREIWKMIRPL